MRNRLLSHHNNYVESGNFKYWSSVLFCVQQCNYLYMCSLMNTYFSHIRKFLECSELSFGKVILSVPSVISCSPLKLQGKCPQRISCLQEEPRICCINKTLFLFIFLVTFIVLQYTCIVMTEGLLLQKYTVLAHCQVYMLLFSQEEIEYLKTRCN